MLAYIIRRLLLMVPTLLGITIGVFLLTQAVPGGPIENEIRKMRFSSGANDGKAVSITEAQKEILKKQFGYDKPIYARYLNWLADIIRLDFGISYETQEPVLKRIGRALPVSLSFGLWAFFLSYLLCIPLGIFKAIRNGTRFDSISSLLLFTAYSIPSFVLASLLMLFFAGGSFFQWFPVMGLHSSYADKLSLFEYFLDYLHHLILPLLSYTAGSFASLTFVMKNSFIEQISQDYVKTARAKGLPEKSVYFKHILRNALIPIITGLSGFLNIFLAGSLLIEKIFGLEGIGLLNYKSIIARDYTVVLGLIFIASIANLLGNLLSDVTYTIVNPKINFS